MNHFKNHRRKTDQQLRCAYCGHQWSGTVYTNKTFATAGTVCPVCKADQVPQYE